MTPTAFYAPLKPPSHPVPSGDRTMARALMSALDLAGFGVTVASELQCRDGQGNSEAQSALICSAQAEIERLVPLGRALGWKLWITYHNYYKAPDLIGPEVSRALSIPYILIEATRARKRLTGPWAQFAQRAETATQAADLVFYFTQQDAEALRSYGDPRQKLVHLRPFLSLPELPSPTTGTGGMLSVGMFRRGDKFASFEIIAQALSFVKTRDWQLTIVGDGLEKPRVQALMAPFGAHVRWLGALEASAMGHAYRDASVLLWPGVNEAFGMAYLEAQAAGLVAIAQDRPGVRDVLDPALKHPLVCDGPQALADQIDAILSDAARRVELSTSARAHIARHHLVSSAAATLKSALNEIV